MLIKRLSLSRTADRVAGFLRACRQDRSGLAAVEFALVLPVMLVAYFGCLEVTQGFQASRKVAILSRSLSDLTSQATTAVATAEMNNIFDASRAVLAPFDPTSTQMTVTSVVFSTVSGNVKAFVDWSTTRNGALRACGELTQVANGTAPAPNNIPAGLVQAGSTVIVADVKYFYTPLLGGAFREIGNGRTSFELKNTTYMRPRSVTRIATTGLSGNNCAPTFP
ncbi:MAG: pilus assembly protein [Methylobacteriaceae bacterium]|nr:pilus assembly protein [Methylobacteriaceae bacterium]